MSVKTGDVAPDFTLFSTEKKEVKLSDYKGKNVLLLFFPGAFTGVCTTEMCAMRDNLSEYNGMNAEILAISVDSLFANGKFKEVNNLNFTVLSDYNRVVCKQYGTLHGDGEFAFGMNNISRRCAYVIDKAGIVCYAELLPKPGELPDFDAVKKTLAGLK